MNNQLTAKQQELDTQTAYLETCQAKASEIKTQIESLTQEDVVANSEVISTLQEDLEAIQTEIVNVENNINTLNATITNLNSNIETLTQEKQDLQNQVNTLTQTLSEKETEINNLNAEITSLNNQITSLQQQLENCDVVMANNGFKLKLYTISNGGSNLDTSWLGKINTSYATQIENYIFGEQEKDTIALGFAESYNVTIKSLNSTQTFTGETCNQLQLTKDTKKSINWYYSNGNKIEDPNIIFNMFTVGDVMFEVVYATNNNKLETLTINCYTTIDETSLNTSSFTGIYTYNNPMGCPISLDFKTMTCSGFDMTSDSHSFSINENDKFFTVDDNLGTYTYEVQDNNIVLTQSGYVGIELERQLSDISKIGEYITSPTYLGNKGTTLTLENQINYNGQVYDLIIASSSKATYFNYSTKDYFTLHFKENADFTYSFTLNEEIFTATEATIPHLEDKFIGQYRESSRGVLTINKTYITDTFGRYYKLKSYDGEKAIYKNNGTSITLIFAEDENGIYLTYSNYTYRKLDSYFGINDKYQGWYNCENDTLGIYIGAKTFTYNSSKIGCKSLSYYNENNYQFGSINLIFTENEDGSISFEWNGNTYTKQVS